MKKTIAVMSMISIFLLLPFPVKAEPFDKVIVYYFHTNLRCPTCIRMEHYTKEAVIKYYADEIKTGTLEFKPVNTDEQENKHFMKRYQLYTKSVVLSLIKNSNELKHENLPKIWEYVGDKDTFYAYIKTETDAFLAELNE